MSRKVILYIAMSLDGYIAKDEDNIDFLSKVDVPGEDYGYADFTNHVDTIIWGRKTYDKLLSFGLPFPHKDKKCYVLSRSLKGTNEDVEFYGGDLKELIAGLKKKEGKHIYCDVGGEVVFGLLKDKLIDEMVVSVIPYLVGQGVRLFKDGRPEQDIELTKSTSYPSGLVQLWYEVK
ncbi:dihydrofolate reductase family protein [Echinicola sediminis]